MTESHLLVFFLGIWGGKMTDRSSVYGVVGVVGKYIGLEQDLYVTKMKSLVFSKKKVRFFISHFLHT